ncbi:MAG: hypothetical protein PHO62_07555 [Sulfurimonas sp.]|uniref:hypothetical protein n=1 Tax=Sulfurimonas sp. TaxID=2022749 RepID=UPI00262DEC8D|nr:hypothetical protein [Sulfurimonas sp.]MDD5373261.1 hypothetical protein [Sulfurimonas sp.]
MSAKRFDKESYKYIKLTTTKSCKGCACTRFLYGTGLQEGAKHMAGATSAFETMNGIGEGCFSRCDMGFIVMESNILNNKEWLEFPIPLEPCPKPSSREYCIARFSDDIEQARKDEDELIFDYLLQIKHPKTIEKNAISSATAIQYLLPLSAKRLFMKIDKIVRVPIGSRTFYHEKTPLK